MPIHLTYGATTGIAKVIQFILQINELTVATQLTDYLSGHVFLQRSQFTNQKKASY